MLTERYQVITSLKSKYSFQIVPNVPFNNECQYMTQNPIFTRTYITYIASGLIPSACTYAFMASSYCPKLAYAMPRLSQPLA